MSRLAGDGAIVCAKASFGGACPLPPPITPEVAAGCATRGGGADEIGAAGALRGMPAGGVGVTTGDVGCGIAAIVEATPMVLMPIGCACGAGAAGTLAGPEPAAVIGCAGALRTDCGAAAPGADGDSRCPQCWQNAKPTGVPFPHAGQIALAAAGCCAAGALATGASVAATVAAEPSGACAGFAISEVPHILQKFMPGGLTVPQALHVVPPAAAGFDAGAASRRWPQS
jgi:hypothetical protein